MFGYLRPVEPELKIKDFHYFRAYYCGLCRTMGKRLGHFSRLTLSYEATFLALLLSALTGEEEKIVSGRCLLHPGRKRLFAADSPLLEYAADVNVLLVYYKLLDDWQNERSIKGLLGTAFFASAKQRAASKSEKVASRIAWELDCLLSLERACCPSADRAAEPFARIMKELFSVAEAPSELLSFSYELGRWLYLIDAFADLEIDLATGSYNPLRYQYKWQGEEAGEFKANLKPEVEFNLYYTLAQIQNYYSRLQLGTQAVLDNIVKLGLVHTTEKVLAGQEDVGDESLRSFRCT